jgi:hypothetical protein
MGCPSLTEIGDTVTLTFSICTHDPDTGILTDADDLPTYRVYEDETAAPIANGSMAKLDDANTTGFYTENITISTGNGYEHGKSYTIYVAATVDGDTGGIAYSFKAHSPGALASVCTEARLGELAVASAGKSSYYIAKMAIALLNKMIVTEADGGTEQFNDAGVSLGSVAAAFSSDGTYTTRKRMVI